MGRKYSDVVADPRACTVGAGEDGYSAPSRVPGVEVVDR